MTRGPIIDFQLTNETMEFAFKVYRQLEQLEQFLDLLRMKLAIQHDFTIGGLVQVFDPKKKGFITLSDLRNSDISGNLSSIEEEDMKYIFRGVSSPKNKELTLIRQRIEYPNFVKMFMPVIDKRFTTLIIQRSEKVGGKIVQMTTQTRQLSM